MAAVELELLTKSFGAAVALDALTLTIAHGSLVCLLGPSGCGKTTTLRLVAGLSRPDRGIIRVGGRTVSEPGRSRAAGAAQHVDDLSELCAVAAHDDRRECRLRAEAAPPRPGRTRAPGRGDPRRRRGSPNSRRAIRTNCRAASSSARRLRGRSSSSRKRCCSTSRSRTSTPICARRCGSRSAACTTPTSTRRSTSRTTRARR